MAQDKRDNKVLLNEERIRGKLLEGAQASYTAVMASYGPKGKNVLVEKPFGRAVLTRDGVTIAREVYFSDRAKNMGAQLVLEASETTNRIAGDGTSATVGLAYHLLKNGAQAIAAGIHPMDIKAMYMQDSYTVLDKLDTLVKDAKTNQLKQVASVSAGDATIGHMIAAAITRVGVAGGIITEKAPIEDTVCEYIDGYYLQPGFQALERGKKELADPFVVVAIKRLTSAQDVIELMTKTAQSKGVEPGSIPRFVFIGNIEDGAYNCICDNINRGTIDAVILKTPPQYGEMGKQLLEDISAYAGCAPYTDNSVFSDALIGSINKIVASKSDATLFASTDTELVKDRIDAIKEQIKIETVDAILEKLKDRVAKLEGKIALFKIGAATDTAREELEYRVEDSIRATRAAAESGIVAGGGITLLELSKLPDISEYYRNALRSVFKQLLINANLPAEIGLSEVLNAPYSTMGYNLRDADAGIVDVVKAGVLDPALVVEQVIKNATEVVASGLTTGVGILLEDREE